jgi:bacterioferritin-associated ferredoxin
VRFRPPAPAVRMKIAGLPVAVAGKAEPDSEPTVRASDGQHRTLLVKGDQLVGATAVGEWRDWERIEDAVRRKRRVSHWRIERFQRGESLWPDEPSAIGRPEGMLICTCNRVDYGSICAAVQAGCKTVPEIALRTRASTTCGACVPVIERILKLGAPPPLDVVGRGVLLPLLGVAALLVTLALLLPLRRKSTAVPGNVALWRLVHAFVGVLAVAAVMVHTGLRLGMNLNRWLSLTLLALAAVGGMAAVWPWGRRAPGPVARGVRLVHVLLFWPALALIGLHVLAVYSF